MSESRDLLRLAERAGVGTRYRDVWGEPRVVAPDTLRAVLAAIGIAATSQAEIVESLMLLEAEAWRTLLPPVVVQHRDALAAGIPLTVPDRLAGGRVLWEIACEDGSTRSGTAGLAALTICARHGGERGRYLLPLSASLQSGYHQLRVAVGDENVETPLIVAPARCFLPSDLAGGTRAWGITTQLYGLRSAGNWGIGDFNDLGRIAECAAEQGARVLGVNPLHALFPVEPRHLSPYSPSSRLFLNPLYIDITAVPDFAESSKVRELAQAPAFQAALATVRAAVEVDYAGVAALKGPIFAALYQSFARRHLGKDPVGAKSARGTAFRAFQHRGGRSLAAYATFNALHARYTAECGFSWYNWPAGLRDPDSAETRAFARANRSAVELHEYLEWEADRQLAAAAARGGAAGLAIGLYRDLAVGVDPHGADAWADQGQIATGMTVGAPPDLLNLKGQNWGLAPTNPAALKRLAYAPFVAALRANMHHAGVLRFDHVMALQRLYWVPRGAAPTAGAYVTYPLADLLAILALESERQRCLVIGEDLGTVPEGFRERLAAANVLSYRVMQFERAEDGALRPPQGYPALATAAFATHDVATLKGYWLGGDLAWRRALALYPDPESEKIDERLRRADRRLLLAALVGAGGLSHAEAHALLPDEDTPVYGIALAEAVHRFLGRTAACLAVMQLEDAVGEAEQANLPGTLDQHPNWRRKLSCTLEELARDGDFLRLTAALAAARAGPP